MRKKVLLTKSDYDFMQKYSENLAFSQSDIEVTGDNILVSFYGKEGFEKFDDEYHEAWIGFGRLPNDEPNEIGYRLEDIFDSVFAKYYNL